MSSLPIKIEAASDEKRGPLGVTFHVRGNGGWNGGPVTLRLGGTDLAALPIADGASATARFDVTAPVTSGDYLLQILDERGEDLRGAAEWQLEGPFFEALRVGPESFLDKVQLHHSRFRSRQLIEMAAHAFYLNHPGAEFVLRGAALTILSHRYLEKPADSLNEAEAARVAWLLRESGAVVAEGAALVRAAEEENRKVDWRHVRWTVSLATVAAHLALYEEDYETSLGFLGMATRHTHLVHYAKVSALNLVICAFAEGVVAHLLGRAEHAREALERGVEAVKPIVQAQNLMENVWVLGDLQNVLRASRQSYIALLRLGLREARVSPPVIDEDMQIDTGEVRSPLHSILLAGRVPALAGHLARHGGG